MQNSSEISYIYGLSSSNDEDNIRYIGYSNQPWVREKSHITESRQSKYHRHRWIQDVLKSGNNIKMIILRVISDIEKFQAEIDMIKLFKSLGAKLVNGNVGGRGGQSPTDEAREKVRLAKLGNTWNKGRKPSLKNREILRELAKSPKSKETIQKRVDKVKGKRSKKRILSDETIISMYFLYNNGLSYDEIVKKLAVKRSSISNVFYQADYYKDVKEKYQLKLVRQKYNNQFRKTK